MSAKHLAWAMQQVCEEPLDKLILIYIGDVFDKDAERQMIDISNIAAFCNCSTSLVMRTLAWMHNEGVIAMPMFGEGYVQIDLKIGRQT